MFVTGSLLAHLRAGRQDRRQAVEVRAPPARRHHALLRRDQPRRRAVRQPGDLRHAGRAARRAEPGHRRGGLEGEDRRLRRRLLGIGRAADRPGPAADRRVGRRVRRDRPRRGARPQDRPMVWVRPVVEGHMGYTFDKDGNKKENGVSGTTGKSWPGDLWKTGGAATWLGGTYNSKTGLAYFGTGNPAPWNSHLRKGDNLFSCSHRGHRREDRPDRLALPEHAQRRLGLRRRQRVRHLRRRRPASWAARPTATASSTSTTPRPASWSTPSRSSRRSPGPPAST
jgi:hypothetical protein